MKTQFYILLSLRTPRGFEYYGQYFFGDNRQAATALFAQLKGRPDIGDPLLLHIDLMETAARVPEKISTICCTLDELGDNVKLVAREIFRLKNLKEL
jgi:hypothetical protein